MNVPAKFEVSSFIRSGDNRGTLKLWAAPYRYAHVRFSPIFVIAFCLFVRMEPVNVQAKFEVRSLAWA